MKLTKIGKSLLVAGGLFITVSVWQSDAKTECVLTTTVNCVDSKHSWVSWLSGNSRSAQFHFVDFLELVSRLLPASAMKS